MSLVKLGFFNQIQDALICYVTYISLKKKHEIEQG